MALIVLFGAMLVLMLLRVALPLGVRIDGEPVGRVTLSFGERVRLQRTNVYAIAGLLLLGAALGDVPSLLELVVIAAIVAILAIPTRYVLTTEGIALNRTVFRPWSDFTRYAESPGRITLVPTDGLRPFHLILSEARAAHAAPTIARFLPRVPGPAPKRRSSRRLGVMRSA